MWRDQRRHPVVAQAAGVDRVRDEVVAQRVHLHQRRHARRVAEVVGVRASRQRRARGRLDGADHRVHPAGQLLAQERERQPAEVRAAAGAADEDVRRLADLGELEERLLADDRLVQQHVVEHRARGRTSRPRPGRRPRPPRRSRCPSEPGWSGSRCSMRAPGRGERRGRAVHGGAEGLDHRCGGTASGRRTPRPATPRTRGRTGRTRRPAPCPTGPRRSRSSASSDPGLGVVVRLRHGGVRLVRAGGRDALVLVVDPRRRAERLLQPVRAVQRRRPPLPVDVEDLVGDVDVRLRP